MVPARRAVVLVLDDKAEVIHHDGEACTPSASSSRCRASSACATSCGCRTSAARRSAAEPSSSRRRPLPVLRRQGRDHRPRHPAAEAASTCGRTSWPRARCNSASATACSRTPRCTSPAGRAPRALTWVIVAVGQVPEHWEPYLRACSALGLSEPWTVERLAGCRGAAPIAAARDAHPPSGSSMRPGCPRARQHPAGGRRARARGRCAAAAAAARSSSTRGDLVARRRGCPGRRAVGRRRRSSDALARPDVARALGDRDVRVRHTAPWSRRRGRTICFAGVGPGEVLLGERKLVGIAQRRTRGCPLPVRRAALLGSVGARSHLRSGRGATCRTCSRPRRWACLMSTGSRRRSWPPSPPAEPTAAGFGVTRGSSAR